LKIIDWENICACVQIKIVWHVNCLGRFAPKLCKQVQAQVSQWLSGDEGAVSTYFSTILLKTLRDEAVRQDPMI
jgi:hypothetical protein